MSFTANVTRESREKKNLERKRNDRWKKYNVLVTDTKSKRRFVHRGLKQWEIDWIGIHPNLEVKVLEKRRWQS